MRKLQSVALVVGLFFVFAGVVPAANPIHVSAGRYRPILPSDSKTANWVVRVVYEHHKDNRVLEVGCEGTIFVASRRDVVGKDKEGVTEELFPFNLLDGSYVCEAVLLRGDGKLFRERTGEFFVS